MKTLEYNSVDPADFQNDETAFRDYLQKNGQRRKLARKEKRKQARSKKTTKTSKPARRAATTPEIEWLRDLICPLVFGERIPEGVRPSITKEQFQQRWNQDWGLPSLANYRLLDHFAGNETLYFFGNGRRWAKHTLALIDIDVQKSKSLGSPEGAKAFSEHLKTIWPDLYCEPSTNGKGIHGYFILRKWSRTATETNVALRRLEKWLRVEAKLIDANIEQVEVKGTCMDLAFNDGNKVQAVKYGMFAKLPRDVSRFSEWENTTTLRVEDLMSQRFDVVEEPIPVKMPEPKIAAAIKKNSASGSVSGKIISEDELASIPAFERLYREWVGPAGLKARKFSVIDHDFAVAMVILRHFKADPNVDGSLPCRRVEKLWTALYVAGDISRPWNHHRWKAVRDFLSSKGHIDWQDHRYEYGAVVQNGSGKTKKGIACKWEITDDLDWRLEQIARHPVSEGEASFVDTAFIKLIPTQGFGKNLRPKPFLLRVELEQKFWQRAYEACEHLYAA